MPTTKMICKGKHVKYEPTEAEWLCPNCGAAEGDFCLSAYDVDENADEECELLHETDLIECVRCHKSIRGKALSAFVVKKNSLVQCPCCKGKGYVVDDGKKKAGDRAGQRNS